MVAAGLSRYAVLTVPPTVKTKLCALQHLALALPNTKHANCVSVECFVSRREVCSSVDREIFKP